MPMFCVPRSSIILVCLAAAFLLAGCGTAPVSRIESGSTRPIASPAVAPAYSPAVQKIVDEARALEPLAGTELSRRFLAATVSLPNIGNRTVWRNDNTREYFSPAAIAAMTEAQRAKLMPIELDESRYYNTKYGSPVAYLRALELAVPSSGQYDVAGKRILDFGYGSIGHLRLLASLGAHITGVDPDSYLNALYSDPRDQGPVEPARNLYRGRPGSITLVHGYFPKDPKIAARVGAGYDLILSKNTLKRGYLKPERKADKRLLISLGVTDEIFLKALHGALNPGGKLLIYNLYPKPAAPNEKFLPWADGRSPFSREQFEKAGFRILALDAQDHAFARQMGLALGWDRNDKGEVIDDLDKNLFALYTVVERPCLSGCP
jgi:hypothetical protein